MNDLMPSSPSTSVTVDLGHGATAHVRDGSIVTYSIRDPWHNTEHAAYRQARLRCREKRAASSYSRELYRYALGTTDVIPDEFADDIRLVRLALAEDRARRAAVEASADALRDQLANGLQISPAPSQMLTLLAS